MVWWEDVHIRELTGERQCSHVWARVPTYVMLFAILPERSYFLQYDLAELLGTVSIT